jgi:YgiT-type zinc finger domain-containing protein
MSAFNKCPVCSGEVIEKEVEKLLRSGNNTAVLRVKAKVCLHCGERLYSKEAISLFEQIKSKLERHDVSEFQLLGKSYKIAG